jgi:hypothetical protein
MLYVSYVECDIPEEMTLVQWRRSRAPGRSTGWRSSRSLRRTIAGLRAPTMVTAWSRSPARRPNRLPGETNVRSGQRRGQFRARSRATQISSDRLADHPLP